MSVVEAVRREVEGADDALAATALAMARELDDLTAEQACEECGHVQSWTSRANSATSKSMCARVLIEVLAQIKAAAPPKVEEDRVDEIAQRRASRVGGAGA